MSSSYESLFTESLNHLSIIDDDDEALGLCLVIILFGIVEAHTTRVRRHNVNRLYLRRQDLLPNPRIVNCAFDGREKFVAPG
jgi:hypothetical protein